MSERRLSEAFEVALNTYKTLAECTHPMRAGPFMCNIIDDLLKCGGLTAEEALALQRIVAEAMGPMPAGCSTLTAALRLKGQPNDLPHRVAWYEALLERVREEENCVRVEVKNLKGAALEYAVERAVYPDEYTPAESLEFALSGQKRYCTPGSAVMALVKRFRVWLTPPSLGDAPLFEDDIPNGWDAQIYNDTGTDLIGEAYGFESPELAICLACVAAVSGPTVNIPKELMNEV